jgi:Oxidoreductase family, C-terminal alpha/beta domain
VVETGDAPKPGRKFFCERGQLNIDRNRFNVMPEELKRELLRGVHDVTESDEADHMRNFLECVRTRKRPNADVEVGQRSVTVAHLANIARWVGGKLEWDAGAERFTNSDKANELLALERREGYELPEV